MYLGFLFLRNCLKILFQKKGKQKCKGWFINNQPFSGSVRVDMSFLYVMCVELNACATIFDVKALIRFFCSEAIKQNLHYLDITKDQQTPLHHNL